MPDCYICGHPILEGQKVELVAQGPNEDWVKVHLNKSGDCLPTLLEGAVLDWALQQERNRAAEIVEGYYRQRRR